MTHPASSPRSRPPRRPGVAAAAALLLAPTALAGQGTALFDATAYVPQPIATTAAQPLGFGKLTAGTVKTVRADDAAGRQGRWNVTGAACGEVELRLTLPTTLAGDGGELPIGAWTADWKGGDAAMRSFTPYSSSVRARFDQAGAACGGGSTPWDASGALVVRIGATVAAAPGQPTGSYSGTLTLQVTYVDF